MDVRVRVVVCARVCACARVCVSVRVGLDGGLLVGWISLEIWNGDGIKGGRSNCCCGCHLGFKLPCRLEVAFFVL